MTTSSTPPRTRDAALSPERTGADPDAMMSASTGAIQILSLVLRHVRLVILTGIVLALVAGGLSMMRRRTWTSTASFTPQSARGERGGGVSGLAASFGISLSGAAPTESPQFYAELLTSEEILRRLAHMSFKVGQTPQPLPALLNIDIAEPERRDFETVKALRKMIEPRPNTRTGIIALSVKAPTAVLAQQLADSTIAAIDAFNLESARARAATERRVAEATLKEYRGELEAAELRYEDFLRGNRVTGSPALQMQNDRLERRVQSLQSIVTGLTSAYEQARIDEVRGAPAIRVIERPRVPVEPNARGTVKIAIMAAAAGSLIAMLIAIVIERIRHARRAGDADVEELIRASRAIFSRGAKNRS